MPSVITRVCYYVYYWLHSSGKPCVNWNNETSSVDFHWNSISSLTLLFWLILHCCHFYTVHLVQRSHSSYVILKSLQKFSRYNLKTIDVRLLLPVSRYFKMLPLTVLVENYVFRGSSGKFSKRFCFLITDTAIEKLM